MSKFVKPSSSTTRKNPASSRPTASRPAAPRPASAAQIKTPARRSTVTPISTPPTLSVEKAHDSDELLDNLEENETRDEMQHDTSERDAARRGESPIEYSNGERLHKLIARAGLSSRRAAEEILASGRVLVNGKTVSEPGAKADPTRDRITVDGQPLHVPTTTTVVLMHKPLTVISTKKDPEGRTTVTHLLPEKLKHLHPIGRLDYDTSGLLFLTDDGSLTQLLTHPSHGVEKTYWARVRGTVTVDTLKKLEAGIYLEDGKTAPAKARVRAQTENNALVQLTLREGRNRQVRRMLEAVGHPVRALRRVRVAGFGLDELLPGEYRVLLPGEVHALRKAAETKPKAKPKPAHAKSPRPATRDKATPSDKAATFGASAAAANTSSAAPQQRSAPRASSPQDSASRDSRSGFSAPLQGRERSSSARPFASRSASSRSASSRSASSRSTASRPTESRSDSSAAPRSLAVRSAAIGSTTSRPTAAGSSSARPATPRAAATGERFSSSALTQRLERQAERREREHPVARRVAQSFEGGTGQSAGRRESFLPEKPVISTKPSRQAKPTRPPKAARVFAAATAEAARAARTAAQNPRLSSTKSAGKPSGFKASKPQDAAFKAPGAKPTTARPTNLRPSAPRTNTTANAKPAARRGERPWGQKTRKRA
jgi:23S rRNA pseudouridine2605 synthase